MAYEVGRLREVSDSCLQEGLLPLHEGEDSLMHSSLSIWVCSDRTQQCRLTPADLLSQKLAGSWLDRIEHCLIPPSQLPLLQFEHILSTESKCCALTALVHCVRVNLVVEFEMESGLNGFLNRCYCFHLQQ